MDSLHDATANRIARKYGAVYNRGQGPDIETPQLVIEVETNDTVRDAYRQLQGFDKLVYIAGANHYATVSALVYTFRTTIGVMGPDGKIWKESSRG